MEHDHAQCVHCDCPAEVAASDRAPAGPACCRACEELLHRMLTPAAAGPNATLADRLARYYTQPAGTVDQIEESGHLSFVLLWIGAPVGIRLGRRGPRHPLDHEFAVFRSDRDGVVEVFPLSGAGELREWLDRGFEPAHTFSVEGVPIRR